MVFVVARDGQLKREKVKPSFLHEQQAKYSRRIIAASASGSRLSALSTEDSSKGSLGGSSGGDSGQGGCKFD